MTAPTIDTAALARDLEAATPGPWQLETVKTSCGICHKIGPFPHEWRAGNVSHACLYDDYPPKPEGIDSIAANARLIAQTKDLARGYLALTERVKAQEAEIERLTLSRADWKGRTYMAGRALEAALAGRPVQNADEVIQFCTLAAKEPHDGR